MRAKAVSYTLDDDATPDAEMDGLVMLFLGDDPDEPTHVLDRIPADAASIICNAMKAAYPKDMDDELAFILGRPNFRCVGIANTFRVKGGVQIAHRAEAEQAFVIHWLIGLYLEHGDGWRAIADAELSRFKSA
jgi:hypothetical protein